MKVAELIKRLETQDQEKEIKVETTITLKSGIEIKCKKIPFFKVEEDAIIIC